MKTVIMSMIVALLLADGPAVNAKVYLHAPDGTEVEIKEGTPQPDLSAYRSPLESKIASRRFFTNDNLYLANEEFLSGMEYFVDAVEAGFPIAHWPQFQWITALENYWYSRYTLEWATSRAHAGISTVHGPYWTLKARELYDRNRTLRDRGERVPANKGVVLSHYMPLYYQRTGMPRVFDDAAPTYLNFTSADPHFIGPVITADNFDDPMSGKKGNWGMPTYYLDYFNTRWSRDRMDKTIDMGGTAQAAAKQAMWVQYFWHSDHVKKGASNEEFSDTNLLGNDAEEGFRGIVLSLAAFNTLLEAKAALFSDERGRLGGIEPFQYDPAEGLRYLPHALGSNLVMIGDLPNRPWSLHVKDGTSRLWDQASWLWLCSEYYNLTQHFDRAFTANPPVDEGVVEKGSGQVALGLASVLIKNIKTMHQKDGMFVSGWSPRAGAGDRISMEDSALLLVALKDVVDRFSGNEKTEQWLRKEAQQLLIAQADFLLTLEGTDGSFEPEYSIPERAGAGGADLSEPLFWGTRGLLAAWQATKDDKYLRGAYRTFNRLNEKFWDEKSGLYRTRLGDDTVTLTPKGVAAAIGTFREMSFAAEPSRIRPLLERFTRFWIQAMDVSGLQMSENYQTGEITYGTEGEDEDGIPFVGKSHGRYGIAPIAAHEVYVNIGGPDNKAFKSLQGELHVMNPKVNFAYRAGGEDSTPLRLDSIPKATSFTKTVGISQLASDTSQVPARADSKLTGADVFKLNCAVCHGSRGQGITGKPLGQIAREGGMGVVVLDGRPMQRMPHWGKILTSDEISRVVEYVKDLFKQ
ncbi:MAG: c-type cytochrome [Elusimicrobia bacterium]|nr:c-type cytochrome [Elusimicrobiota bacterium]